jgi:cell division protein FtsA
VSDPKYATAVGLVLHGLRKGANGAALLGPEPDDDGAAYGAGDGAAAPADRLVSKITSRMRSWFDEL